MKGNHSMKKEDFIEEIKNCPLEELELIYETQKDLYTSEEMELISEKINKIRKAEAERINEMLPSEINCPKCDGPNPFSNDVCEFCGHKIDKSKYYNPEYYEKLETDEDELEGGSSYIFQYIISFLIPIIGYILGAILLSKDSEDEKSVGKTCIILGIVSAVISVIIVFSSIV